MKDQYLFVHFLSDKSDLFFVLVSQGNTDCP